ncbi:zinc-containing alcohol dehydrogenase (ADH) [Tieghemostelium lacteum]|uniref:Zinc-containing alcohol dehydrogenase (ADH) n=1 Tax=Tieghemostelium lacteum TaxID=361077 RepID=A0A151ZKJ4_TIELA|nr:zinc-containing alcohol dehydrogenase (ADH) [Tieghemostelium lacteum]|eukprot:KYQ94447.1 zinc-containing alcohol dehydrogenase (ADH) [Tieghemostelium lacteum]
MNFNTSLGLIKSFIRNGNGQVYSNRFMSGAFITGYSESLDNIKYIHQGINIPKPQKSEVLVKILGSSINPLDNVMRKGYAHSITELKQLKLPLILGRDCSAVIVELGPDVWDFSINDEIWSATAPFGNGSHCEYMVLNESEISRKPKSLSHQEASAIPFPALTAWNAIFNVANYNTQTDLSQKRVLVNGGNGGVGYFAIQILKKFLKCGFVATTCNIKHFEKLKKIGADYCIDYTQDTIPLDACGGHFDLVLNCVDGGDKIERKCIDSLKSHTGHYIDFNGPLIKSADKEGILTGLPKGLIESQNSKYPNIKYNHSLFVPSGKVLSEIKKLFDSKCLETVNIGKEVNLSDIKNAYTLYETGQSNGKIIINNTK